MTDQATKDQGSLLQNNARLRDEESVFKQLTRQRYDAMVKRFEAKYDKRGRLADPGYHVPFTLDQYREWYLFQLGGSFHGLAKCEYCGSHVHIYDLVTDHRLPPQQGGSMGFDNLAASCDACNQQKGEMSDTAFIVLRKLVNNGLTKADILTEDDIAIPNFTDIDRTDLLGRLQRCLRLTIREQTRRKRDAAIRARAEDEAWVSR